MQYVQTLSTTERPWAAATAAQPTAAAHAARGPGWRQGIVAMAAASGLSFLFPVAVLLIGTPLALAVRGLVEIVAWLLSIS